MRKRFTLIDIPWPGFGGLPAPPEPVTVKELSRRLAAVRERMAERGLTHLVVYGDREHFANLLYLTGFDPRFEEALLLVGTRGTPLLLVGNECEGHLPVSPLHAAEKLRHEVYQPLSLLSQPRDRSRQLRDILADEGIGPRAAVGCVGWKYFSIREDAAGRRAIEIPAFVVDNLRELCGYDGVVNATDLFMHPEHGLRAQCSAWEIVFFEHSNIMASEGMRSLLWNIRPGMTDFELAAHYRYTGVPLNCHLGMKSSGNLGVGLSSPCGSLLRLGDPFSTNIGYWGSNVCRAGWIAKDERDLPARARGYVDDFAGPYFAVMAEWFGRMRLGTKGRVLARLIAEKLPFSRFGVFLNPGHLIHYDEWVSSPIFAGSNHEIRSGMYFQVDVIPRSGRYYSTRMEDGIVLADAALRSELRRRYPAMFARCQARRTFMTEVLGFDLPEEILPLSNIPGIVPPFLLEPGRVFSLC